VVKRRRQGRPCHAPNQLKQIFLFIVHCILFIVFNYEWFDVVRLRSLQVAHHLVRQAHHPERSRRAELVEGLSTKNSELKMVSPDLSHDTCGKTVNAIFNQVLLDVPYFNDTITFSAY